VTLVAYVTFAMKCYLLLFQWFMALSMTSIMLWFEYYDYQASTAQNFPSVTNLYNYLISCKNCNTALLYVQSHKNNSSTFCDGQCNSTTSILQKSRGFTIVSLYSEQQVGAAMNLLTLCKWSKYVGISPVEPFVHESEYGLPKSLSQTALSRVLCFRDYFNITYWNMLSPQYGAAQLVSWTTFMEHKPKGFIFVILMTNLKSTDTSNSLFVNNEIENEILCKRGYLRLLANHKNDISQTLQVKLVRLVCMSFIVPMSVQEFSKQIYGGFHPSEVIVWFSIWKGIAKGNRIRMFEEFYHRTPETIKMLQMSGRIVQDSKLYVEKILGSSVGNYVAVSARTARRARFIDVNHQYAFYHNCFEKLKQSVTTASLNISSDKIFLAVDLGRFGDTYAYKYMSNKMMKYVSNELFQMTYNGSFTIDKWEQSFIDITNGVADSGYIAALQSNILQNSGCLVMFGGKSYYQSTALFKYKQKGNSCVIEVCYIPEKGTDDLT